MKSICQNKKSMAVIYVENILHNHRDHNGKTHGDKLIHKVALISIKIIFSVRISNWYWFSELAKSPRIDFSIGIS